MRTSNMCKRRFTSITVGEASVTNIADLIVDSEVTNSAELEQEIEQENECGLAICANVGLVQSQIGEA